MSDSIVAEVRTARDAYARQFNYDLHAMCEDLRREQELSGAPVLKLPKRPVHMNPSYTLMEMGAKSAERSS